MLIALNNENGEKLIEKFNRGLAAVKSEKIYETLLQQWELYDPETLLGHVN